MRVAQRYGCPALGDVVEGRNSTMESVEDGHRGCVGRAGGLYLVFVSGNRAVAGGSVRSSSVGSSRRGDSGPIKQQFHRGLWLILE